MRFAARFVVGAALMVGAVTALPGCPENPYSADTWIEKLDNPKELERAVTELEHLCDPKAIPALGKAWEKNNQPTRILQVIIDLARPMTAGDDGEAAAKFCTDFKSKGRPASWDKALPTLRKAVEDLDTNSQRSIDGAVKAAEALGDAQLPEGVQILIDAVNQKMSPKDNGQRVRLTAIAALGKYKDKSAIVTLANVVRADQSSQPPQIVGAAINALGEMKSADAMPVLIESMYRVPLFFQQVRRALVANGGSVKADLRKILRHEHGDINALFKEKKLDKYCGDDGKAPPSECREVSAMDYYAAIVIGDLYDAEAVPDLITALQRPAKPAYFSDWNEGPPAQNSVLDSLRKIGDPKAAEAVLKYWADPKGNERLRPVAANVYGFVSADGSEKYGTSTGLALLGGIAADNDADQALRLSAAESYGRLVSDKTKIKALKDLAKKYADASAKAQTDRDGAPKTAFDAAKKQFDAASKTFEAADAEFNKAKATAGGDLTKIDEKTLKARGTAKEAMDKLKKDVYLPAKEKFDVLDGQVGGYRGYQRGFENHLARIEIAVRCAGKAECLLGTFDAKPADVYKHLKDGGYIDVKDDKDWSDGDKQELVIAQIERAVLELRRMGQAAAPHVPKLLEKINAKDFVQDRLVRQSVLLALPRIAKLPCDECEKKLGDVIAAGQGKAELNELNYETTLVKYYFGWAGKSGAEAP